MNYLLKSQTTLKLRQPPLPDMVVIFTLAFTNTNYLWWFAKTPIDALIHNVKDIHISGLSEMIRKQIHRELNPRIVIVSAVLEYQVLGYFL